MRFFDAYPELIALKELARLALAGYVGFRTESGRQGHLWLPGPDPRTRDVLFLDRDAARLGLRPRTLGPCMPHSRTCHIRVFPVIGLCIASVF